MSRIGAVVRRLYGEELKPATNANNVGGTMDGRPSRKRKRKKLISLKKRLSSQRTVIWGIRIAVILVALFVAAESIFQFNRLTSWYVIVTARRADIERELQRRENLIPNLVYAVSKYAVYEQAVFKDVSESRKMVKARSSETSSPEEGSELKKALFRLNALAEEYPDLKATQSIQDLIREAANTEDRIADAKGEYNKASETYNQYRTTFPGNVFAFIYRFKPLPYIGLEEDLKVPVIDLNITERGVGIEKDLEALTKNLNKTEGG